MAIAHNLWLNECLRKSKGVNMSDVELYKGYELFFDPAYYDMVCVRPIGSTDFNDTLHFPTMEHAKHIVDKWLIKR